jgi:tripartite-type tricarboxylate transporter receptor subunit TctC
MKPSLRTLVTFLSLALAGAHAGAQPKRFPEKPVRLVVAFAPGGNNDVPVRIVATRLTELWSMPVNVDNRAGAGGIVGSEFVAKAPADGYTLLNCNSATHGVNPALHRKLPYDAVRNFSAISLIGTSPNVLLVPVASPIRTVQEFLTHVKANPGKVSVGTAGIGSTQHFSLELFKSMTGTDLVHVPYKGSAPAVAGLLGDEVQVMIGNLPPWSAQIKAGRVQALAVSTAQRHHSLPDVPALAESLPGFETLAWFGVLAPAGTPRAVVERINTLVNQALEQPEIKARLATLACDPAPATPEAFASRVNGDVARWKKLAAEKNIRAD